MGYNFGVGREAPTFTISAVDGSEINLRQYRGDWFAVLVFVPTQATETAAALAQLSSAADTLWGLRGQLLALCDAGRDEVTKLAAEVESLSFPLLPDDGRVAQAYSALEGRETVPAEAPPAGQTALFNSWEDAVECSKCGGRMVRTGSCYTCRDCGTNTGCS